MNRKKDKRSKESLALYNNKIATVRYQNRNTIQFSITVYIHVNIFFKKSAFINLSIENLSPKNVKLCLLVKCARTKCTQISRADRKINNK